MESRPEVVAIAKDVLKYIPYLNIVSGEYFSGYGANFGIVNELSTQKFLNKLKKCRVCALGACFLAERRISGNCIPHASGQELKNDLGNIFGAKELSDIESAFEREEFNTFDYVGSHDSIAFGKYFKNEAARLAAIMQNIIDHDGWFIPGVDGKNATKYPRVYSK